MVRTHVWVDTYLTGVAHPHSHVAFLPPHQVWCCTESNSHGFRPVCTVASCPDTPSSTPFPPTSQSRFGLPVFFFALMHFPCLLCYQLLCLLVSCLVNKHVRVTAAKICLGELLLALFFCANFRFVFIHWWCRTYHLSSFKTYADPALLWRKYRCPVCNSYQLMTYRALCCHLSPCCCLVYTSYILAIASHLRCLNLTKYCCSTCISPAFCHTQALCCLNLSGY